MAQKILTQEYLQSLFDYREGKLYWKNISKFHHQLKNKEAGGLNNNGYIRIKIDNKKYAAHRLIFLYHHGYLPEFVDHIDTNKSNNRIENLREATRSQNQWNKPIPAKNKTGVKNVSFIQLKNKYMVRLSVNTKELFFGYFEDLELADLVAQEARDKYHKEFARN